MNKMRLESTDGIGVSAFMDTVQLGVEARGFGKVSIANLTPTEARELITMLTAAIAEAEKEKS